MMKYISVIQRKIKGFKNKFYKVPASVPYWDKRELRIIWKAIWNYQVNEEKREILEQKIKDLIKVKYVIPVNLGRSGIELILRGLGLKEGDEVIIPSVSCLGVIQPVLKVGCKPVFADMDKNLNISIKSIEENITPKTKCIIVGHSLGHIAEMIKINELAKYHGLYVIDDAAQCLGIKYKNQYVGTYGDAGIFSFGPCKGLTATGGAIVVTNSDELYLKMKEIIIPSEMKWKAIINAIGFLLQRRYRRYTFPFFYIISLVKKGDSRDKKLKCLTYILKGMNAIDVDILLVQLEKLNEIINKKTQLAIRLKEGLSRLKEIELPQYDEETPLYRYAIFIKNKEKKGGKIPYLEDEEELSGYLLNKGIEVSSCYYPLHLQEGFQQYRRGNLKMAEEMWWKILIVPFDASLKVSQIEYVCDSIKLFYKGKGGIAVL